MALLAMFVLTKSGRNAWSFLLAVLSGGYWNEWHADRLMQQSEGNLSAALNRVMGRRGDSYWQELQRWFVSGSRRQRHQADGGTRRHPRTRRDEASGNQGPKSPTSLSLKTRIFEYSNGEDGGTQVDAKDKNEDDCCCIICMVDLEDGDRIGVLPCGHDIFHVSCLKQWLRQSNMCPLCKQEGVARPNFNEEECEKVLQV